MKNLLVLAVVLLSATMSAYADVTLNGLFTDHMVLQREIPVAVYGVAEPGGKVTVAFFLRQGSGLTGAHDYPFANGLPHFYQFFDN